MASRYLALLRGINVGGKNRLPMAELVETFRDLGAEEVRTYIQSGNVVFAADTALAEALPRQVSASIEEKLGLTVPVLLRSAADLAKALGGHPLGRSGVPEGHLHVVFLADRPSPERARRLDPDRSPGDRFAVAGREIYLLCPNGVARTKLTNAWFDRMLGTVSTTRNWRTARKLLDMVTT